MNPHKNFCEFSLIILKENSDCDVGMKDPTCYLFHFLHVKELCPGKNVPRIMLLWLNDRCPTHILTVLCNWHHFPCILSKEPSLVQLLEIIHCFDLGLTTFRTNWPFFCLWVWPIGHPGYSGEGAPSTQTA